MSSLKLSTSAEQRSAESLKHSVTLQNPWGLLFAFVLIYVAVEFWVLAATNFLYSRFHNGKMPSWKWLTLYAVLFTAIVVFITKTRIVTIGRSINLESVFADD